MRFDAADPHRNELYAAEDEALPGGGRRFSRFSQVEEFVSQVVSGAHWEQMYPEAPVQVAVLRRSRGATFSAAHVAEDGEEAALFIRDGSWTVAVVVHELAHVAADAVQATAQVIDLGSVGSGGPAGAHLSGGERGRREGAHGPTFAAVLLELWRQHLGFQAYGALRSALTEREVPYRRDLRG